MGKKSKLKKIRKIAMMLPEVKTHVVKGEIISGAELLKKGVTEVEGKPVTDRDYREKTVVQQPINHNRRMKKLYNKYGAGVIGHYMRSVHQHVQNKEQPAEMAQ